MDAWLKRTMLLVTTAVFALAVLLTPTVLAQGIGPEAHTLLQFSLSKSYKGVNLSRASPGDTLQYNIRVISDSPLPVLASVSDQIPALLDYSPSSEWATDGYAWFAGGVFCWEGTVPPMGRVMLGFDATVSGQALAGQPIINRAVIQDLMTGLGKSSWATTVVDTPFEGYDNPGKTALDGSCIGDGACGPTECWEYECSDECES